ncbi:alpha/beta hydrolase [Teredinibacter haidensis]|uniref:alpha/beta hydrolase n=1 Tax=Teredinibacter haidensis TaxID=2731755 RepID=UPI0009FAB3E7|nr:alpha/beta hydrolase [Teredinibacter haidensis]
MTELTFVKNVALLLVLAYVGIGAALFVFQRSFIYFPTRAVSLAGVENVEISHDNYHLQGHVVNDGKRELVIYFGGNAEQIAYSLQGLSPYLRHKTLVGFHYRSYSGSEGEPSEKTIFADALYIYDQLAVKYDKVALIGRSLGSGVASYIASQRKIDKLVLVTPYDSIEALAARTYWFYPIKWMITEKYDSASRAGHISCDTLMMIAAEDTIIPMANSEKLYHQFPRGVATLIKIEGAGHNSISNIPQYLSAISEFLEEQGAESGNSVPGI